MTRDGAGDAAPAFALDILEFDAIREQLARHTSFSAGRGLALSLSRPRSSKRRAAARPRRPRRCSCRACGRACTSAGCTTCARSPSARGSAACSGPDELLDVASTVRGARAWRRGLAPLRDETPTLLELAEVYLSDHPGLAEDIQDAIGEGGEVLDSASPALGRMRTELRGAHDRLVTRLREIMASPPFRDVVQDPVVTQRDGPLRHPDPRRVARPGAGHRPRPVGQRRDAVHRAAGRGRDGQSLAHAAASTRSARSSASCAR